MSDSQNFREINKIEEELIFQSLSNISTVISQFLIKSKNLLYISLQRTKLKNSYPKVWLTSPNLQKGIDLIKDKGDIYSAGLYFGFIKKGIFYLSLEGAEFLYTKGILSELKAIYVNKKGEKSILYGNNILNYMVLNASINIKKDDFLLIFNESNEIIAIAYSVIDEYKSNQYAPNELIAINLSDKGIYLRKKQ